MDLEFLRDRFDPKSVSRWMTKEEVDILVSRIQEVNPVKVFESGTANGYSSANIASAGFKVLTFDPVDRVKVWSHLLPEVQERIEYFNKPFVKCVDYIRKTPPIYPTYYFIDGDHTAEGIKADFDAIKPWLHLYDRVMFHDYPAEYKMTRYINRSIKPLAREATVFKTKRGMLELKF